MKVTCPICKHILDFDETIYTPGEFITLECPICGHEMSIQVPIPNEEELKLPTNVKAFYVADADSVRVEWDWEQLQIVQVVWRYKDDKPEIIKVNRADGKGGVDVVKYPKKSVVNIEVSSVCAKPNGESVISKSIKKTVNIPVKVKLYDVTDDGKNKYTYSLITANEVPVVCDLRLLIKEGSKDFGSPDGSIDIKQEQWTSGKAQQQFNYLRKKPNEDLNFRLVAADDIYAECLVFITQDKRLESVIPNPQNEDSANNSAILQSISKVINLIIDIILWIKFDFLPILRKIIIFLFLAVGVYFIWQYIHNKKAEAPLESLYNEIRFAKVGDTLKINEAKIISLQVSPEIAEENIIWNSDSNYVRVLPNGKTGLNVQSIKKGQTTITAKTEKSNQTATFLITIMEEKVAEKARISEPVKPNDSPKSQQGLKPGTDTFESPTTTVPTTVAPIPSPPTPVSLSTITIEFTQSTNLIARIFVDGKEVGTGSWKGNLSKGSHMVEMALQKSGKKKVKKINKTWSIEAPGTLSIKLDPKPFE